MPDIFDVVADPTRRDIVTILHENQAKNQPKNTSEQGVSVSEIVTQLGLNQPTVSKHLKVLRDAGLTTVEEKGHHRYYRLESGPLEEVASWVNSFISAAEKPSHQAPSHDTSNVLPAEARAFAGTIGKAVAAIAFRVSEMTGTFSASKRRNDESQRSAQDESTSKKADEPKAG